MAWENTYIPPDVPLSVQGRHAREHHIRDISHIIAAEAEFGSLFPAAELDTLIVLRLSGTTTATAAAAAAHRPTCAGLRFPSTWRLRYSARALRDSGFARFGQLLDSERYQRLMRRQLHEEEHRGDWVEDSPYTHILDLGPCDDGERRLEHLEALSLPRGIMQWSRAPELGRGRRVAVCLAGGHDDACGCFFGQPDDEPPYWHDQPDTPDKKSTPSLWDLPPTSLDDYCPVRHAANVIRLLRALAGQPLLLNSAARVYTLCGLAKLFGAGGSGTSPFLRQLRAAVRKWFAFGHNPVIVDALPAESLRMAWRLRLPEVVRAAVRILVAERALSDAAGSDVAGNRTPRRPLTRHVFGREPAALDDNLEMLLDHAADALTKRVTDLWAALLAPDRLRLFDLAPYNRLRALERVLAEGSAVSDAAAAAHAAMARLADVCQNICLAMLPNGPPLARCERRFLQQMSEPSPLALYVRGRPSLAFFRATYAGLTLSQKLLTGTFWRLLCSFDFSAAVLEQRLAMHVHAANRALRRLLTTCALQPEPHQPLVDGLAGLGIGVGVTVAEPLALAPLMDLQHRLMAPLLSLYDHGHFVPAFELGRDAKPSPHLLLGLTDNEFRFLPLWAGGQDDGTGAVFTDSLPAADLGPVGPGPAYHTGTSMGTDTDTDTDTDMASVEAESGCNSLAASFVLVGPMEQLAVQSESASAQATSHAAWDGNDSEASSYVVMDLDGAEDVLVQDEDSVLAQGGGEEITLDDIDTQSDMSDITVVDSADK